MKKIVILSIFCFGAISLKAQLSGCNNVCFTYDAGGNRILRYDCTSAPSKQLAEASSEIIAKGLEQTKALALDEVLSAAPNPSSELFQVTATAFPPEAWTILFDMTGKIVQERRLADGQYNLSGLAAGSYILVIHYAEIKRVLKLVKI